MDSLSLCTTHTCVFLSHSAFGKAVQCLAKIGEDLHIEALEKGVSLLPPHYTETLSILYAVVSQLRASHTNVLN